MKILVISDSHGKNDDVLRVIEQVKDFDILIHLGDIERGDDYIRQIVGDRKLYMVAGNNDYNLDLPSQEVIEICGYKVLLTHGHRFYVNSGIRVLKEYAIENNIDIVMFGHTHMPFIEIGDDVTILNPGSISYPRQDGRKPTFLLMEIDDENQIHYGHGYVRKYMPNNY